MITVIAADELILARIARLFVILADELHRRLDRFRAAAECLHEVQVVRRDFAHALHEIKRHASNRVQRRDKGGHLHLPPHRFHDAWMAVAENSDEYSADRVEVAFSIAIPAVQPLSPLDDQRVFQKVVRRVVIDKCATKQLLLSGSQFHSFSRT